ncbi:hypothetical protein HO173_006284 [Letharia columbiana]|uniref:Uncharacterized protein n=1 Tax=Letharia columbiana TaxID=112416 RepID=A0A8H6FVT4_9LECA|nr:uncharacterized protein HO173_006284 [Letharia columbiana]KAF6235601.1 hypothetical protein HO173_006284 [Letharia columbiana]
MAKITTLPQPIRTNYMRPRNVKKEATTEARKEKLKQRDILLRRIPALPEYQPPQIEYRAPVSHFPDDFKVLSYPVFSLIWTATVWDMLCKSTNLYTSRQSPPDPHWKPTRVPG